jgi:hypothetical protein
MLQLLGFIIDCPDPMKLAAFYSEMTGRAIMEGSSDNFAGITFGEVDLAFQRVEDYRPPRWPEGYGWQVYTDPVGHPFCLCRHEGVTWTDKRVVWPSPDHSTVAHIDWTGECPRR